MRFLNVMQKMKRMNVLRKNKFKIVITLVLAFTMLFVFNTSTFAAAKAFTLLPYSLNGGVGNWGYSKRYYWIDSSASGISTTITNAYDSWINTSGILETPISWRQTTTKSSGTVEFYTYSSLDDRNGYTSFWRYNDSVNPNNENWGWCMIYYNNKYNAGQATVAHEIGHTMGLDENNTNAYTIMCQGFARKVTTPQLGDLQGINAKYN